MSMESCEKHGWWEVNGQDACPSCEITRLHAEVERLTQLGGHLNPTDDGKKVLNKIRPLQDQAPDAARVLLDRLHALEENNVRIRWEYDAMKPSQLDRSVLVRLQRAEAVVEATKACHGRCDGVSCRVCAALAAWEKEMG